MAKVEGTEAAEAREVMVAQVAGGGLAVDQRGCVVDAMAGEDAMEDVMAGEERTVMAEELQAAEELKVVVVAAGGQSAIARRRECASNMRPQMVDPAPDGRTYDLQPFRWLSHRLPRDDTRLHGEPSLCIPRLTCTHRSIE